MIVLALMLPLVFWIASRLLQKQLLDPLFNLRGEAGAIADGDLEHAIANTDRRDEIGHLATQLRRYARCRAQTIVDLKETNCRSSASCRRPSWPSSASPRSSTVKLGDNKRQNMTVLFSDIRNFTDLVGEDDAGRELRLHQLLSGAHGTGHPRP